MLRILAFVHRQNSLQNLKWYDLNTLFPLLVSFWPAAVAVKCRLVGISYDVQNTLSVTFHILEVTKVYQKKRMEIPPGSSRPMEMIAT